MERRVGMDNYFEQLMALPDSYGIKELVRTGLTAMGRGSQILE